MKYSEVKGHRLSALSLGTAQLGQNYGIANEHGMPTLEESFAILGTALDAGITSIDTAALYGESEKVIGAFLRQYKGGRPFITTKIPRITGETQGEIEKYVVSSLEASLERLGVDRVNNVMLHVSADIAARGEKAAKAMRSLPDRGYTDLVGASVYTKEDVENLLRYPEYDSVQIPMSIFDQRLILAGTVEKLRSAGVTVFVRSVFLQGLFFLDPDSITDPILLEEAQPFIRKLRGYAEREGMTVAELAIAFMRDLPGVTSLVLGADNPEQVRANAGYFETKPLSAELTETLHREFYQVDVLRIMQVLSRPKK